MSTYGRSRRDRAPRFLVAESDARRERLHEGELTRRSSLRSRSIIPGRSLRGDRRRPGQARGPRVTSARSTARRTAAKSWKKLDGHTDQSIYDISFADDEERLGGRSARLRHPHDATAATPGTQQEHPAQAGAAPVRGARGRREHGVGRRRLGRALLHGRRRQDLGRPLRSRSPRRARAGSTSSEEELDKAAKGEKLYDDIFLNDVFFVDHAARLDGRRVRLTSSRTDDGGQTWERAHIKGHRPLRRHPRSRSARGKVPKENWDKIFAAAEVLADKAYLKIQIEGMLTAEELKKAGDTSLADARADEIQKFLENEGINQDRIKIKNATPLDQEGVDMKPSGRPRSRPSRRSRSRSSRRRSCST